MRRKSQPHHKLDLHETYTSVEKLIYKQAWFQAQRWDISFDEALSECNDAFMRAFYKRYDDRRGMKFSTLLQMLIQFRFRTIQHRKNKAEKGIIFVELEEELVGSVPVNPAEVFSEKVEGLTADGREILRLLLETPGELKGIVKPEVLLRHAEIYLRKQGVTSSKHIKEACEEVRSVFAQVWSPV